MKEKIILRGVRVHNLKNIDLDLPLNKLIIITGVSGSGKSSLAFDTLYAEGQRRYIESLSAYARQFLERMDKPDADLIEGITPAIAIQQKAVTKNPRSTVATVTEIYDFLRVLYARIGILHCLKCGQPVVKDTIDSIVDTLFSLPTRTKLFITFSWKTDKEPTPLRKKGFHRVLKNKEIISLDKIDFNSTQEIDVLVDRLSLELEERERLVDSLEIALREGKGRCKVIIAEDIGERKFLFSEKLECKRCNIPYQDPFPNLFSFNSPYGACPRCHGFGDLAVIDEDKIVPDKNKSLEEGAVEPWTKPASQELMEELLIEAKERNIPVDIPFKELTPEQQNFILEGGNGYYGVKGFFNWLESKKYKVQVRVFLSRYRKFIPCPECQRTRLNKKALAYKINQLSIGELAQLTVKESYNFFNQLKLEPHQKEIAEKLIKEIQNRLKFLLEVGLDYLTLDRMTFTLSGGEAQRINLASALSASLVGTLFVLDEPSIGLHPRDNRRLIHILKSLRDIGNTVIVVEHDPEIIKSGDHIIDLGPGAGEYGGQVIYSGSISDFLKENNSLTAQYLKNEKKIKIPIKKRPIGSDFIEIEGATKHNLKNLNVRLPLQTFTCVTGVSGSGKSTLVYNVLYQGLKGEEKEEFKEIRGKEKINKVVMVDQSPLSTSPRSIPATYVKAMDGIRNLLTQTRQAKALRCKPGYFSFNVPGGRCEECKGAGQQIVEMQFLSDVVLTCEACQGKRFKSEILEIKYKGKNIDQILEMSVSEAIDFFSDQSEIIEKLIPLYEVGLGYLKLGQPTTTLSGGESQRIKLAHHLIYQRGKKILYLFDEPTTGLHLEDIAQLLKCLQKLVDEGNTVIVIEHNLEVIKCADFIIDLGPEGGEKGGGIIFQGRPEEIIWNKESYTGKYLKEYIN
ncbi:MAG: excinuclease ABC subunit UvrA [Candidatus Aminicenantia bacterium]